jgi:LacI family transcriptional regulator
MQATIKDIARCLNISYGTVSRALNDRYGVNAETREKVLATARELNYHPNASARDLVTQKPNTIGLVLPEIENPFYAEIASSIARTADALGLSMFLCVTDWSLDRQASYLETLIEKRVVGLIVAPIAQSSQQIRTLISGDTPVVYVTEAQDPQSNYVAIDSIQGAKLATSHLIERGFTPVYYFGAPKDRLTNDDRYAGYLQALAEHRLTPLPGWVQTGDYHEHTGYVMMNELLARGTVPRGVFAINDIIALGVLQAATEHKLRVPQDVAVAGFDNIPMAAFPEVQLTTISQPIAQMGKTAMDLLWELIQRTAEHPPRHVLLPTQLIVRKSSGGSLVGQI